MMVVEKKKEGEIYFTIVPRAMAINFHETFRFEMLMLDTRPRASRRQQSVETGHDYSKL